MAGLLDLLYAVIVILVTIGGLAFVLGTTGRASHEDGFRWQTAVVVVAVGLFLTAIVVDLWGFL